MSSNNLDWIIKEIASEPRGGQVSFQLRNGTIAQNSQVNSLKQLESMDLIFNIKGSADGVYRFDVSKKLYEIAESKVPSLAEDLGKSVDSGNKTGKVSVRLTKQGNQLYLVVDGAKYSLGKSLRTGLLPERLFEYLLRHAPNTRVTHTTLETEAKIITKRDLDELMVKAGFTGLLGQYFVIAGRSFVLLRDEIEVDKNEANALISASNLSHDRQ